MPKVKNRDRECANCQKPFTLGEDGHTLSKYCCVRCRNQFHWNKQGEKYRNSEKGKQTMFSWRLKSVYGITVDFYNQLLEKQNHSCAICSIPEPMGYGWHIDHCHATNKVRSLLCSKCNQGIGMFDEDTDRMLKAIKYLETHANESRIVGLHG